ncbi:MAG TPA: carbon storage regulator [Candidatus Limnocylindrales bacterium]
MLVLTRRSGQSIRIGPNVEVRVVRIEGDRVVIGIAAPRHVAVVRAELVEQISGEVRDASDARAKLRVLLAPRGLRHVITDDGTHGDQQSGNGPEGDGPVIA